MTVHSCSTQYNTEQFRYLPCYPQTTILVQLLFIGGEVEIVKIFIGILLISITGMDWNG